MLLRNAGFDMLEQSIPIALLLVARPTVETTLIIPQEVILASIPKPCQHFDDSTFRRWHYTGQLIHRKLAKRFLGLCSWVFLGNSHEGLVSANLTKSPLSCCFHKCTVPLSPVDTKALPGLYEH